MPDASSLSPVGIAASAVQAGLGIYQAIAGNAKEKKAQAKIKPYEIPDEIYKILNASTYAMGGDTQTLNFEENQIEQAGASTLGVATKLGADPNFLSTIFGQQITALGVAGERNHSASLEAWGKYLRAQELLADNKAARQKSIRDIAANEAAAGNAQMQSGFQNIGGGISTAIATDSAARTGKLYNTPKV